jgi:hypothetical protein
LIALAFLGASLALGDLIGRISDSGFATLLREGLLIVSDEAWRSDGPAVPTSERRASN